MSKTAKLIPSYERVGVGHNKSWLNSVYLGTIWNLFVIWESLWPAVKGPLGQIIGGVFALTFRVIFWALARIVILVLGFFGQVVTKEEG